MAKPELGTKRTCPVTGRKFYDLGKDPVVSPYTGISYPLSTFEVVRGGASAAKSVSAEADDDMAGDAEAAKVELISLDEAEQEEAASSGKVVVDVDDEVEIEDDGADDDTFLEEEEDENTDVSDLIDGDIEQEEES